MALQKLDTLRIKRFILDLLISGEKPANILDLAQKRFNAKRPNLQTYLNVVYKDLSDFIVEDDSVVENHISRYEELFRILSDLGVDNLAMKVLNQKEELLGIYDAIIEVDMKKSSLVIDNGDQYDLSLLESDEKKRLETLLRKAKNG